MNYPLPQHRSVTSLLEEAIEVLQDEIKFLRSAPVASECQRIEEQEQEKNGVSYRYAFLTTAQGSTRQRESLGRPKGAQHLEWVERIKRRDLILAKQKEIEVLQGVLDRRTLQSNPELF